MSLNSVILAVEDALSDAVATEILRSFDIEVHVRIPNTYQGNTYLRRRTAELNRSAKGPALCVHVHRPGFTKALCTGADSILG